MSDLKLDVDQAGELKAAFRREGPWTNEEIKMLCERKGFLSQVREALLGRAEIKQIEYLVDLDADPFVPEGWKVVDHCKSGLFKYDPAKVGLYLSKKQQNGKVIVGNDLRKELKSQPVYNANLLDFYLKKENQHLIPEEWNEKMVFFWGTIYHNSDGDLYVRGLYWNGDRWCWGYLWLLVGEFGGYRPAVVSAS